MYQLSHHFTILETLFASLSPSDRHALAQAHLAALAPLLGHARAAALGEMGLDAEREHFCPRPVQEWAFAEQLSFFHLSP